jgi:hypothetical protein
MIGFTMRFGDVVQGARRPLLGGISGEFVMFKHHCEFVLTFLFSADPDEGKCPDNWPQ